ncbi:hypothetical protein I6A94_42995, partial [Frankia sp. CN4]|nr:hypothetical protein [Frankia nepalensis]
ADAAHRAERAADAARGRAAALAEQLTAADDAAAAITADGRIAALLGLAAGPPPARDGARLAGHDPAWDDFPVRRASPLPDGAGAVGLDGVTEDALAALRAAVAAGEERRLALTVAADEDRRVLAALDADELRPARPEVVTVRAALAEAGIPAEPGWSYLARAVPAGAREAALRRRPDLADGVVLTGADVPLGRARDVLLAARLLPDAAVTVGTPAAFAGPAEADVFVVPPNPALYDTEAAAADRRAIEARARDRSLLTARLGESIETDRALAAALAGWRRAHPPGRAGALAAELAAALVDGSPCPVCGALGHPDPTEVRADHVGKDEELAAEARAARREAAASEAARRLAGLTERVRTLRATLLRVPDSLPAAVAERSAASPVDPVRELLDELRGTLLDESVLLDDATSPGSADHAPGSADRDSDDPDSAERGSAGHDSAKPGGGGPEPAERIATELDAVAAAFTVAAREATAAARDLPGAEAGLAALADAETRAHAELATHRSEQRQAGLRAAAARERAARALAKVPAALRDPARLVARVDAVAAFALACGQAEQAVRAARQAAGEVS